VIKRLHHLRRHARQSKRATNLLAQRCEHFHFAPGVLMRLAVLHVDHTHHAVARDDRGGKKCLESVFRQLAEIFKTRIAISFAGNRDEPPFARHPSRQTLVQFQPDAPDLSFVMRIGSAQNQVFAVAKVNQARIALGKFHDQRHNSLQNLLQAHVANHEAADFLKQTQLLFDALESRFQVFWLRHGYIIDWMAELNIWKDPGLEIPVAFAPEAMERIRRAAVQGMLSLRRVGVGVGGLLLGRYGGGKVTILDSRAIACAHNFGPSFRLTPEEVTAALAPVGETGELRVVGMYCSKPRGPAEVNDDDRWLFESLCPERWQAILVVSPKSNDASMGAVFSRGAGRALLGGAQLPIEETPMAAAVEPAAVEPVELAPVELVAVGPAPPVALRVEPAPLLEVIPDPEPPPPPVPLRFPRKAASRPKATAERVSSRRPDAPLFVRTVPVKRARTNSWMLWAGVSVIVLAFCIGAFLTRDRWMPRPPLELRSYDSGGLLTVEWNRSAVRGIEDGSLLFTDGADTNTIVLNGAKLHSGSFQYARKSGRVAVLFRAESIQETTTYNEKPFTVAPAPPTAP
jgi:hypothetical protein